MSLKWECLCDDEFYTNNCSGECDLCFFGVCVNGSNPQGGDSGVLEAPGEALQNDPKGNAQLLIFYVFSDEGIFIDIYGEKNSFRLHVFYKDSDEVHFSYSVLVGDALGKYF